VNRLLGAIVFENQDAWPLLVRWIVLDADGCCQSGDDVSHVYTVRGEFLVAVERDTHFATSRQRSYLVQRLAFNLVIHALLVCLVPLARGFSRGAS